MSVSFIIKRILYCLWFWLYPVLNICWNTFHLSRSEAQSLNGSVYHLDYKAKRVLKDSRWDLLWEWALITTAGQAPDKRRGQASASAECCFQAYWWAGNSQASQALRIYFLISRGGPLYQWAYTLSLIFQGRGYLDVPQCAKLFKELNKYRYVPY